MSLQTQKKTLFAPQVVSLPANVEELNSAGFNACVVRGRPCVNAVAIYPHRDPTAITLCCKFFYRTVSVEEASGCINQA